MRIFLLCLLLVSCGQETRDERGATTLGTELSFFDNPIAESSCESFSSQARISDSICIQQAFSPSSGTKPVKEVQTSTHDPAQCHAHGENLLASSDKYHSVKVWAKLGATESGKRLCIIDRSLAVQVPRPQQQGAAGRSNTRVRN